MKKHDLLSKKQDLTEHSLRKLRTEVTQGRLGDIYGIPVVRNILIVACMTQPFFQLGYSPKHFYEGDLTTYVEFRTMLKNNFEVKIKDEEILFMILLEHLNGTAKDCVQPCIFSDAANRFPLAVEKLQSRFASKLGAINAHKNKLYSGGEVKDDVNG